MVCRWRPDSSGLGNRYAIPTSANQRRLRNLGSCQVCRRIMRWHNGRTRRSPNPNPAEVLRDCVTNGERSAAHSILARSLGSNKGRIHLRRPTCHSHFSLAARRRTIHDGWSTTRPEQVDALRSRIDPRVGDGIAITAKLSRAAKKQACRPRLQELAIESSLAGRLRRVRRQLLRARGPRLVESTGRRACSLENS